MRSVMVEVKQEDIDAGVSDSSKSCPVALAIKRASGFDVGVYGADDEFVDAWVSFIGENSPRAIDLPTSARDFIAGFDLGHEVDPFSFELVLK